MITKGLPAEMMARNGAARAVLVRLSTVANVGTVIAPMIITSTSTATAPLRDTNDVRALARAARAPAPRSSCGMTWTVLAVEPAGSVADFGLFASEVRGR